MYLEELRKRLAKLAAKTPAVPKTPKTPSVSSMANVSTPKTTMNIKTPKIKMPASKPPSAPKLPSLKFPTPQSTISSTAVPPILQNAFSFFNPMTQGAVNPLDFMKNLFNNNAAMPPGL